MNLGHWGIACCGFLLAGCATLPSTVQEEAIELGAIKGAVECEFAAALRARDNASWRLNTWVAKSTLDLTVIQTVDADGKLGWVIPAAAALKLSPAVGAGRKDTSIAHLEFATGLKKLAREGHPACVTTDNPSQTGLGLAAWIDATLIAFENEKNLHRGLSYTSEFEISTNAGARFGYTITNVDADIGGGVTRIGTNRISIAMAPPSGEPDAIPVYTVADPHAPVAPRVGGKKDGKLSDRTILETFELSRPPLRRPRVGSDDNSAVNRMLILRAPVRIER